MNLMRTLKNFFILLPIALFVFGCASKRNLLPESDASITIESIGVGESEDQALQTAFKKAVLDASGAIIYSSQSIEDRALLEDKIGSFSQGFIQEYEILDKKENGGLFVLTVKSEVKLLPLKNIIAKSETRNDDDLDSLIKKLRQVEDTQEHIRQAQKVMDTFIGDEYYFFRRAYDVNLVGYEVQEISSFGVKGDYLVRISLKKPFWDSYEELLSVIKVEPEIKQPNTVASILKGIVLFPINVLEAGLTMPNDLRQKLFGWKNNPSGPQNTIIKSKNAGLYEASCPPEYKTLYTVPEEVEGLPFIILSFGRQDWKNLIPGTSEILFLSYNVLHFDPIHKDGRKAERLLGARVVHREGYFDNMSLCESAWGKTYIPFKDHITVRIPFRHTDTREIKETVLKNSIPWTARTLRGNNGRL